MASGNSEMKRSGSLKRPSHEPLGPQYARRDSGDIMRPPKEDASSVDKGSNFRSLPSSFSPSGKIGSGSSMQGAHSNVDVLERGFQLPDSRKAVEARSLNLKGNSELKSSFFPDSTQGVGGDTGTFLASGAGKTSFEERLVKPSLQFGQEERSPTKNADDHLKHGAVREDTRVSSMGNANARAVKQTSIESPDLYQSEIGVRLDVDKGDDQLVEEFSAVQACLHSDTYQLPNVRYQPNGEGSQEHHQEDDFFSYQIDGFFIYGVFDGHDGCRASYFARREFPKVLIRRLLQLNSASDDQIQEVLRMAFKEVESRFFRNLDPLISEKMTIQMELEGLSSYEAYQRHPDLVIHLQELTDRISGGATAAIAIIYCNKLFVANVGDSRVLLGLSSPEPERDGAIICKQVTVDHDCGNKEELRRLEKLGLNGKEIARSGRIGSQQNTRSIGDYSVKGGYREFDILSKATGPPVIAEPFISKPIQLDRSCLFLALFTDGIYKSVEDSGANKKEEDGNNYIGKRIVTSMLKCFPEIKMEEVCHRVVERIAECHQSAFLVDKKQECRKRDDMTLLVRGFVENAAAYFTDFPCWCKEYPQ